MYPKAYIDYLVHFHCDRDYFECHEVLEEHWKEDDKADRKPYWVALIQIAVSLYHHRRGNIKGSLRMLKSAVSIIGEQKHNILNLGLDVEKLLDILKERKRQIENGIAYESINLPIVDQQLLSTCKQIAKNEGKTWGKESDLSNKELIHKHSLRDRSDVIAERQRQIILKQQKRKK